MSLVKLSGIVLLLLTGTALTVDGYVRSRSPLATVPVLVQPRLRDCPFDGQLPEACEPLPCEAYRCGGQDCESKDSA